MPDPASPASKIDDNALKRLFDASLDAVIGMDHAGLVIAWSKQAEAIFGRDRDDAIGRPLADLIIPPELRQAHADGLSRYLDTGSARVLNRRIEIDAIDASARRFPVELTILPVGERGNEDFFAFIRDITERRGHAERQKQRALETEVLWEATLQVASGGSLEELFRACLARICQVTGWHAGHVYLPDDQHAPIWLLPSAVWHFENPELAPIALATSGFKCKPGEGLPGKIWSSGSPEWIPDISQGEGLPRKHIFVEHGLGAAFGFPIMTEGKLQAVLEFFSTAKLPPDQHLIYVIQSLGQQLGRVLERHRAQQQQQMLLRELSHRVGNSLAVLQSVFRRSAAHARTVEELRTSFEARIRSMAVAHKLLAEGSWEAADVADIMQGAVHPYCSGENCRLAGPHISISASLVMALTMVLHELATNAAKHGAFSVPGGTLELDWAEFVHERGNRHLSINWRERGVSLPEVQNAPGYGTSLIEGTVKHGLHGQLVRELGPNGLTLQISFPLDR